MSTAQQALLHVMGPAAILISCLQPSPALAQGTFLRGNANGDVKVDISDAVFSLAFLFLGGPNPACPDAADANDDGKLDISDAVFTLAHLFLGGPAPPPPGLSEAGPDPTADALSCGPADTEPPAAATDLAISPPSGANDNDPEITGTAEPGATVEVFAESAGGGAGGGAAVACAGTRVASGVVEPGGTFRIAVGVEDDTSTAFSVQVVDAADNVSTCSEPLVYVEDSTAPPPPVITGTVPSSPSSERSPQVVGTTEPNADVAVFLDGGCSGAPAATGQASGTGSFSIGITVPSGATTAITARATDGAGNQSACSTAASYTHVAGAPATRLDFSQQPGSAIAGRPFWLGVAARDDAGNLDSAFSGIVTIAIGQGPDGAVLSGTVSGAAEEGVFRTGDVTLDLPGTYIINASTPGLIGDETTPFVVRAPGTPPSVVSLSTSGDTGCIELRYRLAHPQSQRAEVRIEFSPDAQSPFQVATPSGAQAVFNLRTAPQPGVIHRFHWNSSVDLTGDTSTARIRVTPSLASDGTPGEPFTLENVLIDWNRFELLSANQLSSPGVTGIAAGDLNNDGRIDFASTNPPADTVTVHFQDSTVTGFFSSTRVVGTGDGPAAVDIVDFDRDGKQDIIVPLGNTSSVQVLRNDGAGGFVPTATGTTGAGPTALAMGDLNSDGQPDAVTANEGDGSVSVLLQGAAGTFLPPNTFAAGTLRKDIRIADFNRDGALDLAAANVDGSSVSIFLQDPSSPGTYVPVQEIPVQGSPESLTLEDLNDDGRVDLIVALRDQESLLILYGRDGGFVDPFVILAAPGTAQNDVDVADLDGDLRHDIATAGNGGPGVQVQRAGDPPSFEDSSDSVFNPGVQLTAVATVDWSGDGVSDVVWASTDAGALYPYQSRPSLCASPVPLPRVTATFPGGVATLATGFIDGDSFMDVFAGGGDTVTVFAGLGNGALRVMTFFQEGELTTDVLLPDVDGDGDPDICWTSPDSVFVSISNSQSGSFGTPVVSHPGGVAAVDGLFTPDVVADIAVASSTDLTVRAGDGAGRFDTVSSTPAALSSIAAGDLNSDGGLDVVGAVPAKSAFQVFTGDRQGNLAPDIELPAGLDPGQVVVFDANGDGQEDVAGIDKDSRNVLVYTRGRDGRFNVQYLSTVNNVRFNPRGIAVGDVNGDEVPDIMVADADTGAVIIFEGQGNGKFEDSGLRVPVGSNLVGIDLATLDGDPSPDMVVAREDGIVTIRTGGVLIFADRIFASSDRHNGVVGDLDRDGYPDGVYVDATRAEATVRLRLASNLGEGKKILVGAGASSVSLGDVNRDGKLDIILTYSTGTNGKVLFGDGTGDFTPGGEFTQGFTDVADTVLGDIDRDGDLDLLMANGGGNEVTSLLGNGGGTFTFLGTTVTGNQPASIVLADLNQNGIQDLIAANTGSGTVTTSNGDGTGRFAPSLTLSNLPDPTGVAVGDVQRDGRSDLVVAHALVNPDQQSITYFPGTNPPGTFGPGAGIYTGAPTQDVLFSGNSLVGFNGQTLSLYAHNGGSFFTLPETFVIPVELDGAPALADPEDAEQVRFASNAGFCAVGRFEHLGGPAVQRAASLLTILLPLVGLALLGRRERRRRERAR